MHELSVCQALIQQVEKVALARNARVVIEINVQIGPLSGVESRLLQQAFSIACAGTIADGARLNLTSMPVSVRCRSCDQVSNVLPTRLVCGHCGDWRTSIISGDDLLLTTVEIATAVEPPIRSAGIQH
jgi:hydrogenase nickel incorporation protein HypA/HybF